ncbi:hypothetical protein [Rugosimonospora acidiphila]
MTPAATSPAATPDDRYFRYPPEPARIDPFETTVDEPQYIDTTNSGITYGYLPGSFEDVPDAEYRRLVPTGYTSLMRTQKLAVAREGRLVREWPLVVRRRGDDWWYSHWGGYRVWRLDGGFAPIADPKNDPDSAMAALLSASRPGAALLLYIWVVVDWH